ncbi:hypothetical protein K9F62_02160 [Desulfovibrio sp. JY]|nr:hypothetical protein K9F62_02160 [Desulfovibrio sp. JY]
MHEVRPTFVLGAKPCCKLAVTHTLLEAHRVFCCSNTSNPQKIRKAMRNGNQLMLAGKQEFFSPIGKALLRIYIGHLIAIQLVSNMVDWCPLFFAYIPPLQK